MWMKAGIYVGLLIIALWEPTVPGELIWLLLMVKELTEYVYEAI